MTRPRGAPQDPRSLHRYLYAQNNSVTLNDPMGLGGIPWYCYIRCLAQFWRYSQCLKDCAGKRKEKPVPPPQPPPCRRRWEELSDCEKWETNPNYCGSCCDELGEKCVLKHLGSVKAEACRHRHVACDLGCSTHPEIDPHTYFIGLL